MSAALIAGLAVITVIGGSAGIWLARQPKQHGTAAAGRANSHRAAAAVGFTCAACGHGHSLAEIQRSLYLGSRSVGDLRALQRGRLGRRLVRRRVTRTIMRHLWS